MRVRRNIMRKYRSSALPVVVICICGILLGFSLVFIINDVRADLAEQNRIIISEVNDASMKASIDTVMQKQAEEEARKKAEAEAKKKTEAAKKQKQQQQTYKKQKDTNSISSTSGSEAEAKEWIAQKESGGNYNAVSPSGKYIGRYQLSKDKLNGDYSKENQERTADNYVKNRYGSWQKAKEHWQKYGWY